MSFFTMPLSGFLSDRLGRKRVHIFGAIATGLFAFAAPGLQTLVIVSDGLAEN
jgi:MFS family permease